MACDAGNPLCDVVDGVADGALGSVADGVGEFVQWIINQVAFGWVLNPIPLLIEQPEGTKLGPAPGSGLSDESVATVTQLLGWLQWLALFLAALSLIVFGARLAILWQREGSLAVDRLVTIFGAVFLVGSATFIVTALLPDAPISAGGTVASIQGSLWWFTLVLAMVSVIIGGIRMVWRQEAREGKEILRSLLTLMAVAALGVTVVSLLEQVFSDFSRNYLLSATDCGEDGACLGTRMTELFWMTGGTAFPPVAVIVLGLVFGLFGAIQFALMIGRVAILILLVGVLPLASSFTNTEMGMQWMRRIVAWTLAFLLYKPVAALIFGTAMRMVGADVFGAASLPEGVAMAVRVILGVIIFALGVVALPALMRLMMPAVSPIIGGSGGMGMALAGAAAIPAGASAIADAAGRGGRGSGQTPPGATNAPTAAPTGGREPAMAGAKAAGSSGAQTAGAAGTAGTAAVGAGAKAGATAAAGAASGGTAAAVMVAAETATKAAKVANDGAQQMAKGATGEDSE